MERQRIMKKKGRKGIMVKIERLEDNDVDEWKDSGKDGEERDSDENGEKGKGNNEIATEEDCDEGSRR